MLIQIESYKKTCKKQKYKALIILKLYYMIIILEENEKILLFIL